MCDPDMPPVVTYACGHTRPLQTSDNEDTKEFARRMVCATCWDARGPSHDALDMYLDT